MQKYKFTIITSTLNCKSSLLETCNSIRGQTFKGFQWIVIDGASSDGTVAAIRDNQDLIESWITEPDTGIYDAWNKACKLIKGEWVIFLGAGDQFFARETLEAVSMSVDQVPPSTQLAYGNVYQFLNGEILYRYGRVDLSQWDDYRPKLPAHQGIFHRAAIFNKARPFDDSYKVVADSKLLLSELKYSHIFYLNVDICKMLPGGVSSSDGSAIRVMKEFLRLENDVGYQIPLSRKAKFILSTLARALLFKLFGPSPNDFIRNLKRKIQRS